MVGRLANIDPIRREPLATEIARRLVDYLLSGEVEPGGRMPSERQLAEAFGVGRSAMREALKALTLLGLLEVRHGDGTYVKRGDAELLPRVIEWGLLLGEQRTMDLVEARQKVEVVIAVMAAERRSDDDVAALRALLARMEAAGSNQAAFVDADVAFHLRLASAAGNSALRDILSGVQALLRAWISRVIAVPGNVDVSYREHVPVFEAVAKGDPQEAARAMEAHMASAAARLRQTLAETGGGEVRAAGPAAGGPRPGHLESARTAKEGPR